jgi:hydroxymethylglutaryl-CoA lyase
MDRTLGTGEDARTKSMSMTELQALDGLPTIEIVEEGLREGLQIEKTDIPIADRVRLLNALSQTGLKRIVVGSFVSPRWTPQMADIDEVVRSFTPVAGVNYSALALNQRGVERREQLTPPLSEPDQPPQTYVHLCDVFAQRNTNRTQAQEIARWPSIIDAALASGSSTASVGLGAAWGSNWTGPFTHTQRMEMLETQVSAWEKGGIPVSRVFLADPMGWNQPHLVAEDIAAIQRTWPQIHTYHLHLHNTRGTAMASIYAAIRELDSSRHLLVDSSIGGMAGCPYGGNGRAAQLAATEDVVHLLEGLGHRTGIDLSKLIRCVWLAEEIVGHQLYGHVSKAGPRPSANELYAMDMPFIETLDQARHFIEGPVAYQGCLSPWSEPITSAARKNVSK